MNSELPEGFWFVGWNCQDFKRWLREQYPRPKLPRDHYLFQLFEIRIPDEDFGEQAVAVGTYTYTICVNNFAKQLESLARNGALLDARFQINFYHGNAARERWKIIESKKRGER